MLFINQLNNGMYRKINKTYKKASLLSSTIETVKEIDMIHFNNANSIVYEGTPILLSLDGNKWLNISKELNPELFI